MTEEDNSEYHEPEKNQDYYDPEDKFLKITNEFQEALCITRIPGEARQVFDCVIRQTLGYHKYSDAISMDFFCTKTGLLKSHVSNHLKTLIQMNLVSVDGKRLIKTDTGKRQTNIYKINCNPEKWTLIPKKVINTLLPKKVSKSCQSVTENDIKVDSLLPNSVHTKDNNIKNKKHTKDSESVCPFFSIFEKAARKHIELVSKNNPAVVSADLLKWCAVLESTGKNPDEIEAAIVWAQNHDFWNSRTMTAENFVKNYPTIATQMNEAKEKFLKKHPELRDDEKPDLSKPNKGPVNITMALMLLQDCDNIFELVDLWTKNEERWKIFDVLRSRFEFTLSKYALRIIKNALSVDDLDPLLDAGKTRIPMAISSDGEIMKALAKRYNEFTGEILMDIPDDEPVDDQPVDKSNWPKLKKLPVDPELMARIKSIIAEADTQLEANTSTELNWDY